jgi:hypothetical protein
VAVGALQPLTVFRLLVAVVVVAIQPLLLLAALVVAVTITQELVILAVLVIHHLHLQYKAMQAAVVAIPAIMETLVVAAAVQVRLAQTVFTTQRVALVAQVRLTALQALL